MCFVLDPTLGRRRNPECLTYNFPHIDLRVFTAIHPLVELDGFRCIKKFSGCQTQVEVLATSYRH